MIRDTPDAMAAAFLIVFVCTGNRFRSPLAAELLRRATDGVPVEVASVGTLDLGALPALPEAIEEAARLGIDLSTHRARSMQSLQTADLVVGFERIHVVTAVVEGGASRERAFTLTELVHHLELFRAPAEADPLERARLAIALANGARPPNPLLSAVGEISDPLGKPRRVQRQIAEQLQLLTDRLAAALFHRQGESDA